MTLQGSWRFEEGTGTTSSDTSGLGRTLTNIPAWSNNGHTGSGMAVNGTGGGGRVAIDAAFTFFDSSTFMCWVKLNSLPAGGQYIMAGPRYGAGGDWNIAVSSSGVLSANWGSSMTGSTLSTGVWYHIAFTFDWASGGGSSNSKLYVNGIQVATSEGFPLNPGTFYWGGDSTKPLNGVIDDARWYSEQLSQTTVQSLMNTPVGSLIANSGATRFWKDTAGNWQPARTQRIVGPSSGGTLFGWQLTAEKVGLNKHGINGDKLPLYTGSIKPASGAIIRGKKIVTSLDLSNGNITIDKCYIKPDTMGQGIPVLSTYDNNAVRPGLGPVTISDCTLDGSLLNQFSAAMSSGIQALGTITGNYIHGFGSGIAVMGVGDQYDALIEGNYVTGLIAWGDAATDGNHSDAFTIRDFTSASVPSRQITIQNNRFDCQSGNDTGSCFLQTYSGNINNVTIQGNLLEGGGYNMGLEQLNGTYSNVKSLNNRFTPLGYGAFYIQGGPGFSAWSNNYLNDVNATENKGTPL